MPCLLFMFIVCFASWSSTTPESQVHQKPTKKQLPKKILAMRAWNLRSRTMRFVLKSPGFSKIRRGPGAFPAEIPTTAEPNYHLSPSFPRNPLVPPRNPLVAPSTPVQRRLQSPPAKSKFLAVIANFSSRTEANRRRIVRTGGSGLIAREWIARWPKRRRSGWKMKKPAI
jgi:hypothetical protein